MSLLILLGDNPRFYSIEDHVVNSNSVSQVNGFLDTQYPQDF